ncbi:hypothetical protein LXL04_028495 [Taraxacum kok-saghyz]
MILFISRLEMILCLRWPNCVVLTLLASPCLFKTGHKLLLESMPLRRVDKELRLRWPLLIYILKHEGSIVAQILKTFGYEDWKTEILMEDILDTTLDDISKPVWENMVESPIIDHVSASIPLCKYKLKLKYGGFFRLAKNTTRKIYCFGSQKCIYIDIWSYNLSRLIIEVIRRYSSKENPEFSISYVDKYARDQSFIELDSDEKFMTMLSMYEDEKEVTIYVTTDHNHDSNNCRPSNHLFDNIDEPHDDSDYCPSEESYYSHLSSDNEDPYERMNDDDGVYSFSKASDQLLRTFSHTIYLNL